MGDGFTIMWIEYPAVALSMLGSILVSSSLRKRRMTGFLIWLISNTLFIIWAIYISAWAVILMYLFFSGTSIKGFVSNKEVSNDEVQ